MSHVVIDLKASIRSFLRNKSTIFWTIAFPCVLILLFGAIFSQSSTKYDLYVQNQDIVGGKATYWSDRLIGYLNATDAPFNIQMIDSSVNATDYAITNRLSSLLVIPFGFGTNATSAYFTNGTATAANVTLIYDQSTSSGPIVRSIVMSIVENINFGLSNGVNFLNVQDLTIAPQRYGYIDFFLPGVIGMTAMTTSIFTSVSISAQFKQNGVFHKLATTPLKRYEWILSRTVYNVLITYLGMSVMLILGVAVFGMKMTVDAISLFMVAMASLMFTGLGMIIARFVKDPDGADAAANVITFPMMFLSGTFFPLSQMPLFPQAIARVLPLTYVSDGLRASMIFGQSQTAIINTAIITVLGVACIVIGSWITKWEED
ncbi:MAG: ABC transporter permease [Candidatus Bathyarchaeia archaeon]|jgi:ABC-2 type transport system permease protein